MEAVPLEPAREGLCMAGLALAEAPASALSNALDASCLTARCRGAAQTLYGELCGRDDHRQTSERGFGRVVQARYIWA